MYISRLTWDERNVAHIARHGVNRRQVEETCSAGHYSRRIRGRLRRRYLVIGQSEEGRFLTISLDRQGRGVFYPVTARDSTEDERRLFQRGM